MALPIKASKQVLQSLLEKASKKELIRSFNGLTIEKIIESKPTSLGQIQKDYTQDKAEHLTMILVADFALAFKDDLSKYDFEEIVLELNNSLLRNLSLEDVYLCLKELKSVKMYGKVNVNQILVHFNEYSERKQLKFAEYSQRNIPKGETGLTLENQEELQKLFKTVKKDGK